MLNILLNSLRILQAERNDSIRKNNCSKNLSKGLRNHNKSKNTQLKNS